MEPIILNEYGEELRFDTSFATREDMFLESMSLWHRCGQLVRFAFISETHYGIYCLQCGRILDPDYIPNEIDTPAKLRQWCEERIKEKELLQKELAILWKISTEGRKASEQATKLMQRAHRDARLTAE